jgi:purine-binding chemotaxis protein CheW
MTIRSRAPEELDAKAKEVLAQRAERLRAAPAVASDGPVEWVAEFPVGEDRFAIPLSALRSVVPLRRVTAVPLSRPHVVGILRFQGHIITALSMASLLGIKGWRQDPAVLLVVDPGWGRLVAIDCEEVPRPLGLTVTSLEDARARGPKPIIEVAHAGHLVHLIDLGRLLDRRTGARGGP